MTNSTQQSSGSSWQRLAAAALTLGEPLGALNGKPGDLMYQMAEDLHGLMGFGIEPHG